MTTSNTTITTPTATLTEKELFAQFLQMHIQHWTNFGTLSKDYRPEELLNPSDDWFGPIGALTEAISDILACDDDPTERGEEVISAIEDYVGNLRLIISDFKSLKGVKLVMPERPDDQDKDDYEAWETAAYAGEDNPRYHPVTLEPSDDVAFLEDGSEPAPLSKPEFVKMTPDDEASIREA
ncbi:hypothetical protein [Agrobacterium tumefaciens]|uniref:Uncharacterized protein n=1 Tax=Agrobacterium tumefaciens TaxID=358 RepID=A0AA44F6L8_AGRTU|nr:hypothetical protein [Agrobacterium tumefaciens]NSL24922.1 hypothetical protein [Agrobacterium tumefaciens]NTB86577.1 hypothetical protein [Agrobacterium tumefaciens]NTC20905.1 hypothetical protein [Agrobacterium tumefaciens]NTC30454.1 hypothetical protein [Agrobacterium tumefaciens]NTC54092.1 hypothetical protein [Agrobacterium tumefaciens]